VSASGHEWIEPLGLAPPLDGACYRASLFLKLFLEQEYGIDANVVVGFVNDGTDELYASHAWLECHGQFGIRDDSGYHLAFGARSKTT
jgi:hypothetical protein